MGEEAGELETVELGPATYLHVDPRDDLKTIRTELLIAEPVRAGRNTRLALLAQVLERGTRRLPDSRRLSRFVDELYGADFGASVERCGAHQALRLVLETVDPRFVPDGAVAGGRLRAFLHDVLCDPVLDGGVFPPAALEREKAALATLIASVRNDKLAYAQRRCLQVMCAGEPAALSVWGEPEDLPEIDARGLWEYAQQLLRQARIDVYVSGHVEAQQCAEAWQGFFDWPRRPRGADCPAAGGAERKAGSRTLREPVAGHQGWLVLGYRTPIGVAAAGYASLLLCNQLWGADAQSRLFRVVREQEGLCYHIASDLDAAARLALVSAGIEPSQFEAVTARIGDELERLAAGQIDARDLASARRLEQDLLQALPEDPAALASFDYRQRLLGSGRTRASLWASLAAVTAESVAAAAATLRLDIAYLACPAAACPEAKS